MTNYKKTFTPDFRKSGYLCIGRNQLKALFSADGLQRQLSFLLLCVQTHAYFSEGKIWKRDCAYFCHVGEWIVSLKEISNMTKIDRRKVSMLLKMLEEMNFLNVYQLGSFKRITLINYNSRMLVSHNPSFGGGKAEEAETKQPAGFFRSASDLYSLSHNEGEA